MKNINCVGCGKELKPLEFEGKLDMPIEHKMIHGGFVDKIHASFGSGFDGDVYCIGICDDCVENKKEDGSLIFLYERS